MLWWIAAYNGEPFPLVHYRLIDLALNHPMGDDIKDIIAVSGHLSTWKFHRHY